MTHKCPKNGCDVQVEYSQLACKRHWYQIPRELRNAVNRAWNRGTDDEHRAAMAAAIDALNGGPT